VISLLVAACVLPLNVVQIEPALAFARDAVGARRRISANTSGACGWKDI
jgi:hypothetical protein